MTQRNLEELFTQWFETTHGPSMGSAFEAGYRAAHAHAIDTSPEGWKLVPVEPTQAMCRALFRNLIHADNEAYVIKAVMAAAPSTKEGGG